MLSIVSLSALSYVKHASELVELYAEMANCKSGSKCVFHTSFPGYSHLILNDTGNTTFYSLHCVFK